MAAKKTATKEGGAPDTVALIGPKNVGGATMSDGTEYEIVKGEIEVAPEHVEQMAAFGFTVAE